MRPNAPIRHICLFVLLLSILLSSVLVSVSANDFPTPPSVEDCRAACLYDKTHDRVLLMENGDEPLPTSTSAKVMMGLIACELLEDRQGEKVTITERMLEGTASLGRRMDLAVGEEIRIIDLLYGAICGSYNDAPYILASICSKGASEFVGLMNERARELGATSTNYVNPLGYPDNSAMVTTVNDTLKIAIAASDNELYMEISSAKKYDVPATNVSGAWTMYNRNDLITTRRYQEYYNPVCRGINAGSTGDAGGWSVITSASDDGAEYICIVLGGGESEERIDAYDTVNSLINWACETYNLFRVFKQDQVLGKAKVEMTALGSKEVTVAAKEELSVYIPDHSDPDVNYSIKYVSDKLSAPLKKGDTVGVASVFCNGEFVGECEVVLTEDCEQNAVMKVINTIGEYTRSRAFIATLICLVILMPTAIIITRRKNNRHSYRRKF